MVGVVEEALRAAVRLHQLDLLRAPAGEPHVAERLLVHREEPARRAVLRRHVPDGRAVGQRKADQPVAEVLDELADDTGGAEDLRHREHEVGRGRSLGQLAGKPEADDARDEHRDRLAEEHGLGLDPAHAPAEHAEPVDHRRVRVGPDERVRERERAAVLVARLDHAREVLEVDLVDDAGVGRDDAEVVERRLAPAQEGVALAVPLELALGVLEHGHARAELVDLHRVVDDELGGDLRIDRRGLAAEVDHRLAHRGQVDDRRDAREVLQEHARGAEGDLVLGLGLRVPAGDGAHLVGAAVTERLRAEDVLEQHPQRVRQARDVGLPRERVEACDRERPPAGLDLPQCAEGVCHFFPRF